MESGFDDFATFFHNLRHGLSIKERSDVVAMIETMRQISNLYYQSILPENSLDLRFHFVITWGLREPFLLNHYLNYLAEEYNKNPIPSTTDIINNVMSKMDNDWNRLKRTGKYEYIPVRLRHKHSPAEIKTWNIWQLVENLPHENHQQLIERIKIVKKGTFGNYNSQHLMRQWYLQTDEVHPSNEFIVMGAGASAKKYKILKEAGLRDISTIRAFFQLEAFDAGTLAYVLCQNRFLE